MQIKMKLKNILLLVLTLILFVFFIFSIQLKVQVNQHKDALNKTLKAWDLYIDSTEFKIKELNDSIEKLNMLDKKDTLNL